MVLRVSQMFLSILFGGGRGRELACKYIGVAASQVQMLVFLYVCVFLPEPISSLYLIIALDLDIV